MKTKSEPRKNKPEQTFPLDAALRTKTNREDALDIIAIRDRKNEARVSAIDVFKKAGL